VDELHEDAEHQQGPNGTANGVAPAFKVSVSAASDSGRSSPHSDTLAAVLPKAGAPLVAVEDASLEDIYADAGLRMPPDAEGVRDAHGNLKPARPRDRDAAQLRASEQIVLNARAKVKASTANGSASKTAGAAAADQPGSPPGPKAEVAGAVVPENGVPENGDAAPASKPLVGEVGVDGKLLEVPSGEGNKPPVVTPTPRDKEKDKAEERDRTLRELVEAEERYSQQLNALVQYYMTPLEDEDKASSLNVKPDDIKALFCNVKMMNDFHKMLARDMLAAPSPYSPPEIPSEVAGEAAVPSGEPCGVLSVLLQQLPYLRMYMQYVSHYDECQAVLDRLKPNKKFHAFLHEVRVNFKTVSQYRILFTHCVFVLSYWLIACLSCCIHTCSFCVQFGWVCAGNR